MLRAHIDYMCERYANHLPRVIVADFASLWRNKQLQRISENIGYLTRQFGQVRNGGRFQTQHLQLRQHLLLFCFGPYTNAPTGIRYVISKGGGKPLYLEQLAKYVHVFDDSLKVEMPMWAGRAGITASAIMRPHASVPYPLKGGFQVG